MSSSYAFLTTFIVLLILFLYLSWVFVSIKFVAKEQKGETTERRDFLFTVSYALGAVGVGAAIWP